MPIITRCFMVCLCVCLLDTTVSPMKTTELTKVPWCELQWAWAVLTIYMGAQVPRREWAFYGRHSWTCTEVYAVEVLSLVNIICKVAEACTELYAVEVLAYSTLCELQWAWAVLTIYMGAQVPQRERTFYGRHSWTCTAVYAVAVLAYSTLFAWW